MILTKSLRPLARPDGFDARAAQVVPAAASNDTVARAATTSAPIPRAEPMLIGIFGSSDDASALVRLPSGKIAEVSKGSRIGRDTVVAVAEDSIILQRGKKAHRLSMPDA
ncbi:hypothetical protein [Ponticoccus sp. (in: a-proteobacteria)]|uniref:hypothetical protein n=1 Tax=Ponticoccus sp. (in: a-proteobacteria) TaxID=1925025 RepID=UPI0019D36346|nr:hypothetical protein [Enemella evansiae]